MFKRSFDIIFSLLLIIIFSPLFIFLILIYFLFFNGKPIYISKRVGKKLEEFKIYKFRSMIKNAENLGPEVSGLNDKRNLIIGRFIRLTKIDELPQLYNILIGDMSFVGPRPNFKRLVDKYPGDVKEALYKLKPGLTDYSSLIFRDLDSFVKNVNFEKNYFEKVEPLKKLLIIQYYLKNSFFIDLKIIFFTIISIFRIYKFTEKDLNFFFHIDV
jgi:lipopolysaccharide/colanic/teichoic acid biosynthesis glycosyltransferase